MPPSVYTIGYGGRSMDDVVAQLLHAEVRFVVDVRSVPHSRYQPEFSKQPLAATLGRRGIRYVFMGPQLGGRPDDPDCYTDGHVDYEKCRSKDFFLEGIHRIRSAYKQGIPICLLCSEGKPWQCHRSKLIGTVLESEGIPVLHLAPKAQVLSQAAVIAKITGGQQSLFGDHLLSRKAYR